MTETEKEVRLIYVDTVKNNNKFWHGRLLDNGDVYVEWGRVGYNGQNKTHKGAGERKLNSLIRQKLKKGYTKQKIVAGTIATSSSTLNLEELAANQIASDSNEVVDLVRYLAKKNVHNIVDHSGITYDEVDGVFKTPLGVVTKDGLDEARLLLQDISQYVADGDLDNKKFLGKCSDYMRIIPTNIGMRKFDARHDMGTLDHVRRQNDILDSLEVALQQIADAHAQQKQERAHEEPKIFQCSLSLIEDEELFNKMKNLYNSTLQHKHACSHLKLKRVFAVEIERMVKEFEEDGLNIGNIMELWHGTRAGNLLSILKSGFVIPPSNAAHCTGRLFGNGIYFSDQSTKSLNYAYGYWSGSRDNNCYMLLNHVAMGKAYTPRGHSERLPKAGYDSTFVKAGTNGVINNEMIIYRTSQVNPLFLCQFNSD